MSVYLIIIDHSAFGKHDIKVCHQSAYSSSFCKDPQTSKTYGSPKGSPLLCTLDNSKCALDLNHFYTFKTTKTIQIFHHDGP